MALYAVSDIHGRRDVFHALLEKIRFSRQDRLIILGDVIDRGPEGIPLLQEIMAAPNMTLLLGNHELMLLEALDPGATEQQIARWGYNHNQDTLRDFLGLSEREKEDLMLFLRTRPDHLDLEIGGKRIHLVHGFPGTDTHDRVWGRPGCLEYCNPLGDVTTVIGHTPVPLIFCRNDGERDLYFRKLQKTGGHVEVLFAPEFIDIDCGCGHSAPGCCLACLNLETMEAIYEMAPKDGAPE